MNRTEILKKANECVMGDREQDYGSPESNFELIANLWSAYLDFDITAVDVAMMMSLLKVARVKSGRTHEDNFIDLAGYAACAGEIATNEEERTTREDDIPKIVFCKREQPTFSEKAEVLRRIFGLNDPREREYAERKRDAFSNPPDVLRHIGYNDWFDKLKKAKTEEDTDEL